MAGDRWHMHAVCLPEGEGAEDAWIVDGRITSEPQPDCDDLPGGWMLPGLVDAHVHLSLDMNGTGLSGDALVKRNLDAQFDAGVALVRDVGALPGVFVGGPRVHAAGRFLAPPNGYIPGLFEPTPMEDTVRAALAELERGAVWVKLIADFPHSPDLTKAVSAPPNYDRQTLAAVVDAVHAAGGRVATHTTGSGVADAVAAGVDSIEHGNGMTEDALRSLGARGGAWTPTFTTARDFDGHDDTWHEMWERIRGLLPKAAGYGVTVMAGTDGKPHGTIADEVAALHEFGLDPTAALAAASTAARTYLGANYDGADLVLYTADPRNDPEILRHPSTIVLDGRRRR
jgi:imidazolonepropionase-like amidohydrolase